MRGNITEEIRGAASELLGSPNFDQSALRLMPYLQYCLVNHEGVDLRKVTATERAILSDWREKGFISGGTSDLCCTKDFWNAMHEIIWLGYAPARLESDKQGGTA